MGKGTLGPSCFGAGVPPPLPRGHKTQGVSLASGARSAGFDAQVPNRKSPRETEGIAYIYVTYLRRVVVAVDHVIG